MAAIDFYANYLNKLLLIVKSIIEQMAENDLKRQETRVGSTNCSQDHLGQIFVKIVSRFCIIDLH